VGSIENRSVPRFASVVLQNLRCDARDLLSNEEK
jgi:hypothetical protein